MAVSALFSRKQQIDAPYTGGSYGTGDEASLQPNLEGGGEGLEPVITGGEPGDSGGGVGDAPYDPNPFGIQTEKPKTVDDPSGGLFPDGPLNPQDTGDLSGGVVTPPASGGIETGIAGSAKGPADLKGAVYGKLLDLINRDPSKSPASAAYRTSQQRQQERDRALLAERASAEGYGTDSGAFDTDLLGLNQVRGENEANFDANQTNQQEQMILQALGLGGNLYGNDLNRDLNASQFEQLQNSGLLQLILQQLAQQGGGAV